MCGIAKIGLFNNAIGGILFTVENEVLQVDLLAVTSTLAEKKFIHFNCEAIFVLRLNAW